MNTLNTFFDDSLYFDMEEIETSSQELEDIIGELFQEESYDQPSLDEETFLDDTYSIPNIHDFDA